MSIPHPDIRTATGKGCTATCNGQFGESHYIRLADRSAQLCATCVVCGYNLPLIKQDGIYITTPTT